MRPCTDPYDWWRFTARFLFGAALGSVVGLAWLGWGPDAVPWWLVLILAAVVIGLIVALNDDDVFEQMKWWT